MVSLDGGRTLVPYQGLFERKSGPLVGYLAVKVTGYWTDMCVTVDENPTPARRQAEAALDALIAAMWLVLGPETSTPRRWGRWRRCRFTRL